MLKVLVTLAENETCCGKTSGEVDKVSLTSTVTELREQFPICIVGSESAFAEAVPNPMSANLLDFFSAYVDVAHDAARAKTFPSERRRRARTRVHWPVLLFRSEAAEAISSVTQDLSSCGFYCLATTPVTSGEVLSCTIKVPTHDPNGKHLERYLECRVRVV